MVLQINSEAAVHRVLVLKWRSADIRSCNILLVNNCVQPNCGLFKNNQVNFKYIPHLPAEQTDIVL